VNAAEDQPFEVVVAPVVDGGDVVVDPVLVVDDELETVVVDEGVATVVLDALVEVVDPVQYVWCDGW